MNLSSTILWENSLAAQSDVRGTAALRSSTAALGRIRCGGKMRSHARLPFAEHSRWNVIKVTAAVRYSLPQPDFLDKIRRRT